MLFPILLITSVCVNIALAIYLYKTKSTTKESQFKVKVMQGWADEAYKKIKSLEDTRSSLLEHMANMETGEEKTSKHTPTTSKKPTRRSSKKSKK